LSAVSATLCRRDTIVTPHKIIHPFDVTVDHQWARVTVADRLTGRLETRVHQNFNSDLDATMLTQS